MTGFPESFQRSTVAPFSFQEDQSEAAIRTETRSSSVGTKMAPNNAQVNSLSFPQDPSSSSSSHVFGTSTSGRETGILNRTTSSAPSSGRGRQCSPVLPHHRVSRSNVMRLESILNDVSMNHDCGFSPRTPRSRSLGSGRSPVQTHLDMFTPPSPTSTNTMSVPERSESPEEEIGPVGTAMLVISNSKKKKVKMHKCPECQKDFPRPSGLRTHMNMHTKEKPFTCTYPGCARAFSVVSNARRHMRTHGLGVSADDNDQPSTPYVVGFEDPMVLDQPDVLGMHSTPHPRGHPFRLRWIPPGVSIPAAQRVAIAAAAKDGHGDGGASP